MDYGVAAKRKKRIDRRIKAQTDGVHAISSWSGILYLIGPRLALILGLISVPLITSSNPYWQRVFMLAAVIGLLGISFDFLLNYVGLVCLGGAMFVGVGGYASAILNSSMGLPPLLCLPIATIAGAAFCTLMILPVLGLSGVYFAIVTLIYPLLMERVIEATGILGGTEGIFGISLFPNRWFEMYAVVGALLFYLFGLRRLVNEDIGMVFRGVKDNELSITGSGMNIIYYKVWAVFIASVFGCFGGAYLSHVYQWAGMSLFATDFSIMPIAVTVMGGSGTLAGPVLGSYILVSISEWLREFGTLRMVLYAIVIILFVTFWREGLLNWLHRKYEQFDYWEEV